MKQKQKIAVFNNINNFFKKHNTTQTLDTFASSRAYSIVKV